MKILRPATGLTQSVQRRVGGGGGRGVLPYMGYIGMCRYDFQAVYSRIGYINQSVWV